MEQGEREREKHGGWGQGTETASLFCWSLVDLQCCVSAVQQSGSVMHIYSSPLWLITGYGIYFPVLYSRILLFIQTLLLFKKKTTGSLLPGKVF